MNENKNFKLGLVYCILSGIMLPALVCLIVFSALYGNTSNIVSMTLFGVSLFLLYLFNTLYYWIKNEAAKHVFSRFVHIFSYIYIASFCNCFYLGPLIGPWGWSLFGVTLGLACLGIIFSSIWESIPNVILEISYLIISCILFIAIKPLVAYTFLNINFIGLILFISIYILNVISSILKSTNRFDFSSNILKISASIITYIFVIKYLLFI